MTDSTTATLQKKICMIGAFGVGKTSLVKRFVESIFDERYHTTVGVTIDKKRVVVGDRQVFLVLWDLAGEDDLRRIRMSHLRGASGYILVADGSRSATLEQAQRFRQEVESLYGQLPFVLALNKIDLADEWEVAEEAWQGLDAAGWHIFLTSAKTGQGVEDLFMTLAATLISEHDE
jgi:hypothetical protein